MIGDLKKRVTLEEAKSLPIWRQPIALLVLMAISMPVAFHTWMALINNFVVEVANFDGSDIGWLHTVREIPGFLAVLVIYLLFIFREQVLGLLSLAVLGIATAITAHYPTFGGIMIVTLISSIGFHYYETVNQSLQLQWINRKKAPQTLGWLMAAGSAATLLAYLLIITTWRRYDLDFSVVYWAAGGFTTLAALFAYVAFPQFEAPHPQKKEMVLRRRYWLYYALQFMAGARRQVFVVFAGFMMVERFGFDVHEMAGLLMATLVLNIITAPILGKVVAFFGERAALVFEYIGLFTVFVLYAGIYYFDWGVTLALSLYVVDHLFFSLALAMKTYFQKIADPGDIAPTAAVAFTINHIAAVFLPFLLGYLWLVSPGMVFMLAAGMALVSLTLATLIPRHPEPGNETRFAVPAVNPAE